jgi:hypothetical protein
MLIPIYRPEAFIKVVPVISVPRLLNSMFPLFKVIPDEDSVDKEVVRKNIGKAGNLYDRGVHSFEGLFGKPDTDSLVARCTQYWPDLRKSSPRAEVHTRHELSKLQLL